MHNSMTTATRVPGPPPNSRSSLHEPRTPGGHGTRSARHADGGRARSDSPPRVYETNPPRTPASRLQMLSEHDDSREPEFRSDHMFLRPEWTCRACSNPWPCATVRLHLLAFFTDEDNRIRYDRVFRYLAPRLVDAIPDLPNGSSHDLHYRFLGWIRSERARRERDVGQPPDRPPEAAP